MILRMALIGGIMGLSLRAASQDRLNDSRFSKMAASSGMPGAEASQRDLATAGSDGTEGGLWMGRFPRKP